MDDAFINKGLQGPVHGHPVKFFPGFFFNIAMCQGAGLFQEKLQYFSPASRNTQVVFF